MRIGFWDTETTGKLTDAHRIIELSLRVFKDGVQIENHLWRFNPERSIDARAFAVHNIALDDLKHEPLIKDKLAEILALFETLDLVVHHNGDTFDIPFLTMEAVRNGFTMPEVKTFDTIGCNFASEIGKSPSLRELCWAFDVDYDLAKAHAGDYDTEVLAKAFYVMIEQGWINLEEISK